MTRGERCGATRRTAPGGGVRPARRQLAWWRPAAPCPFCGGPARPRRTRVRPAERAAGLGPRRLLAEGDDRGHGPPARGARTAPSSSTCASGRRPGQAVYKPLRGERPLWDFPPGLYRREVGGLRGLRGPGLGPRARDRRARRAARHGLVPALRRRRLRAALLHAPRTARAPPRRCEAIVRLRPRRQQRRPQERPLPARTRTAASGPSTTASASTPSPSCAP